MSVTDEIKARLDIVDFIGNYAQLKKAGRNYKALCPFHNEKTPSFVVFPDSQNWRCFGACGEGGDIFSFVMKREGWEFPEALRFLAEKAGVELQPVTPQQAEARDAAERLRSLLADSAGFFTRQLMQAPNAAHARDYVAARGLTADTVAGFEVGYAPNSWDATMNFLLERGYDRQELVDAGMLVVKDDGGVYDRFRDRLIIPIRDVQGGVVGFGARALAKDAQPKYLNSPQSPVFDKSQLLFGLSHARRSIRETETAVIVEGYMDVMQAHQSGFTNVVAQMGTALTEPQLHLLSRYASRLILALDPDAAGQMATDRGREVIERVSRAAAEQAVDDGVWDFDSAERDYRAHLTPVFDPHGMVRYESRLGFDIRVIVLPEGQDPDDLIRDMPDAWIALVEQATPIVEYVIRRTTEGQDLDDPKVKSQVAAEIIPLIEDVADPVERSHYQQRLARLLKVSEDALFPKGVATGRRAQPSAPYPPYPPDQAAARPREAAPGLAIASTRSREAFCLAALICYPRLLYRVNRVLAEYLRPEALASALPEDGDGGWSPVDSLASHVVPADFSNPEHRSVFAAWQDALNQDGAEPIYYLLDTLDPLSREEVELWLSQPLYALFRGVTPPDCVLTDEVVFEKVLDGLLNLRKERLNEQLQELRFLLEEFDNGGDAGTAGEHGAAIGQRLLALWRVEKALEHYSMPGRRLNAGSRSHWQTQPNG